jgi:CO/xanthine dehydrogenase FAD-binding subunit
MFDHVEAFHQPASIGEAVRMLRKGGSAARIVAGGTDVVVQADRSIRCLVDIKQLGLDFIRRRGNECVIGATTTLMAIEQSPVILALANGILAQAASTCGSVQIRNMATVGGNLANASPAADTATPLLVLEAHLMLANSRGRRKVPLADFFLGPHKTAAGGGLLMEIAIPMPPRAGRIGWSFQKLGRVEGDIALVSASAGLQFDRAGRCQWGRIALGAVGPTPLRARNAERLLAGQQLEMGLIERVADEVAREVRPVTDVRASAEYRREMSRVLVRRALRECAARAGCPI